MGKTAFGWIKRLSTQALSPAVIGMAYAWGKSHLDPERRDALSDHAAILLDLAPST